MPIASLLLAPARLGRRLRRAREAFFATPSTAEALSGPKVEPWIGQELANRERAELYTWTKEDEHPSKILRTRSDPADALGQLYDRMMADTDLAGYFAKLQNLALSLPRTVEPDDPVTAEGKEAAALCSYVLGQIPALTDSFEHQTEAHMRGIAFEEVVWDKLTRGPYDGAVVPVDLIDRPMARFAFKQGRLHIRRRTGQKPILAPPAKFLVARKGSKDSPWGGPAMLDSLYWYYFLKRHGWKWYAVFIEKWASPTAMARYKHNRDTAANSQAQQDALLLAQSITSEQALAVPEHITAELIEASRSGAVSYPEFIKLLNRGMANRILGEVGSSGLRPGTGAYASDRVAQTIRYEKVALLAGWFADHLRRTLLAPIVQVNLGPDHPVPRLCIEVKESGERALRQQGMAAVLASRQPVPRSEFYLVHQVREPKPGEPVVQFPAENTEDDTAPVSPPEPGPDTRPPPSPTPADPTLALAEIALLEERHSEEMEAVAEALEPALTGYWQRHRAAAQEAYDPAGDPDEQIRRLANALEPEEHANLLTAAQVHGIGLAFAQLQEIAETDELSAAALAARPFAALAEVPRVSRATTPRTAAQMWLDLLTLDKAAFRQLADQARRLAFTVAGVHEAELLGDLHDLLGRAHRESWGVARWRQEMEAAYNRRGLEPTSSWHADLVLANNVRQANAAARWRNLVGNPSAHAAYPFLRWDTADDDDVRARRGHNHRLMAGKIFAIGHVIWRTWWYPAGHNCRCTPFPISRRRAARLGLTGDEPTGPWPRDPDTGALALPDPGFRSGPGLGTAAEAARERLEPIIESARRRSPSLLESLNLLLDKLGDLFRRFFL